MIEYRCAKCKRLLMKGQFSGTVEIKCHSCKKVNVFETVYAIDEKEILSKLKPEGTA